MDSAVENPMFVMNNAGGPFAQRIHDDASFREEILKLSPHEYVGLIEAYAAGVWPDSPPFMSVPESWVSTCEAPILVLPGQRPLPPDIGGAPVVRAGAEGAVPGCGLPVERREVARDD